MSLTHPLDTANAAPIPGVASAPAGAAAARARLASIDLLRGLVMIVMALDHARDFFGASGPNPRDVTEPALFLTRWITHYCAPLFIFLAGISAWLHGAKGRTAGELSRYLFVRGFWLIVLEFTIVRIGWTFSPGFSSLLAGVLWAIGWSMIALAALVHLPRVAIAVVGIGMIAGHNLLDPIQPADFGAFGWLWTVLHEGGANIWLGETRLYVLYPLIPWIGVMAAGYALGPVFAREPLERRRWLIRLGLAVTATFLVLRAGNFYGDPAAWRMHESWLATVLSFLNCEKYPPSLLYLCMTLGPGLLLLAAFDRARGRLADWIATYGRAPLAYYVAHIYLLHAMALFFVLIVYRDDLSWLTASPPRKPADYGLSLPGVYAVWLMAVALLYPFCRWMSALKRRSGWWWSFL